MAQRGSTKGRTMIEAKPPDQALRQDRGSRPTSTAGPKTTGIHLGTNRCPAGDHRPIDGTYLPASLVQPGNGLGPAGGARRPADHAPVHLSHRERRLPRRLRNARRARGPGRPPVAPDRAAGDPDPGSLIPPAGANLPSQRRPGHDQHDVPPSEPPGRPARCRHGRLPRRRRLFGAELSRGDGGAGELRGLPRQSVAERVLPGLRLVREAA